MKELTQEELAEVAGVHPVYISLIENGRRTPTLDVAARIAAALSTSLSILVAEAERSARRRS